MRRIFVSRSSLEKPRPLERFVLISSPSRTSTDMPRALISRLSAPASVVLPAPDNPVNHNVNPFLFLINVPSLVITALPQSGCVHWLNPFRVDTDCSTYPQG